MKVPRPLIDAVFRLRRRLLALLGWRTRGAKVLAYDGAGRMLLIRNRYGKTHQWVLPGGGVHRRETFLAAAVRELREETALELTEARHFATYRNRAEKRRDTVQLFVGTATGTPEADGMEVAEVRFFAPDDLPDTVSPATRRRLDEVAGCRAVSERW